jgi:type I restriction enzyme S subunit
MSTDTFHEHSVKQSKGSVNPYINFRDLTWYEFLLPPIDVQQQIVEVLAVSAALEESHSVVEHSIRQLMDAMAHAVAERCAATGTLTPISLLVEDDRPVTYGILKPGTGYPGGVPVIKVRDYPNGSLAAEGLLLTSPKIDHEYKRSRLRAGDILISIRGTVGRLAEVPNELANANITQDTARLSIREEHDSKFVRWMLGSQYVQRQVESRITGLAVKGINIGALRQIMVPTPPLDEQRSLTLQFNSLDSLLQCSQCHSQATRKMTKSLRDHLLEGDASHVQ